MGDNPLAQSLVASAGADHARLRSLVSRAALLDRFRGFELLPEGLVWNRSLITSGPLKMPVRFLPG